MAISAHDGMTEITGEIIDPSHLQGLLDRIGGLGLTLHSVTPLDTEKGEASAQTPGSDQIRRAETERPQLSQPGRAHFSAADDGDWEAKAPTTTPCRRTPSRRSSEGTLTP